MTSLPAVTALPDPPSREDDSDTFVQKADAFVAALITMVSEFNAALQAIPLIASAINYNTTSSTSWWVASGWPICHCSQRQCPIKLYGWSGY
jgi:hypothetical protein